MLDLHYLTLLSKEYPTIQAASARIISLQAMLSLPKGTEYFFSDLHGEHEAFLHLLRSASGVIRKKIDDLFEKTLPESERNALAMLVYYPEQQIQTAKRTAENFDEWCRLTLYRLIDICGETASKYARSKVRGMLPPNFDWVIDELLHADGSGDKTGYYSKIIGTILEIGMAERFIVELSLMIQRLTIDRLHIIGDIFDRGPHADKIMDALMDHHDADVQWGNHDIGWIGAASGNWACILNVLRLGISYNNFDQLEDGYGINLRALSDFAARVYRDDPCERFLPHLLDKNKYDPVDLAHAAKMHKAIAVMQLKAEGQLIERHPEYEMGARALLERIDFQNWSVRIGQKEYPLLDHSFPTVDPARPLAFTPGEEELMRTLAASFRHSERLHRHIRFLFAHGGMFLCVNANLLYHGCIPMTEDGAFDEMTLGGKRYWGRAYLEHIETLVRRAYFSPAGAERESAVDFLWYLWCGPKSPLFGKDKLTTFERYFIEDTAAHRERMNPYYAWIEKEETCEKILNEFGLDSKTAYIINGHVPIRLKQGESPVKAGGRLFIIDGGLSKAYQKQTGIGGYTLISNSRYLALAEHQPYSPPRAGEQPETQTSVRVLESFKKRVTVADTDQGEELRAQIAELKALLAAYRDGSIKERGE